MQKRHIMAGVTVLGCSLAFWALMGEEPAQVHNQSQLVEEAPQKQIRKTQKKPSSLASKSLRSQTRRAPSKKKTTVEPEDEIEVFPGNVAVKVHVVNYDDELVRSAFIQSRDCRVASRAPTGSTTIQLPENTECTLRAGRRDGMLTAWSEWVKIDSKYDEEVYLDLPAEKTAGMGVSISKHPEGMQVFRVVPGSPAETAGLMAGDIIVELGGHDAANMDIETFVNVGTGPIGTSIELIVSRANGEYFSLELTRALLKRQRGA